MFIQVLYNDDNSNDNDNSIHNNNNGNLAVNNPGGDFYWSRFPVQQDIWVFFCFFSSKPTAVSEKSHTLTYTIPTFFLCI